MLQAHTPLAGLQIDAQTLDIQRHQRLEQRPVGL